MDLFFCSTLSVGEGQLDNNDFRHCVKVLRKREGDQLLLIDGKGNQAIATIQLANPKACRFTIESIEQTVSRNKCLHIAIAPTKSNDRFEWFLEKACELGIEEISPIITRYSERKQIKLERYNKVLIAAMKQSGRSWLPQLNPLQSFKEFLASCGEGAKAIAYVPESPVSSLAELSFFSVNKKLTSKAPNKPSGPETIPDTTLSVLIGPEGGFSEQEWELAKEAGFQSVSLGEFRLRTETAGVHVASLFAALVG